MTLGTDDLNDDVLTEILVRLPPRSVLRSRAVCKRWRHAATSASFVAAYSLRRPLDVILYPRRRCIRQYAIDRVPLDAVDGCRRLLDHGACLEYCGSCDGLLLFSVAKESFVICNPATRQCARFPALAPTPCMWVLPSGFYLHRPSGEHRVLCFAMEIPPRQYYDSTEGVYKYKRHVHDPCPYDEPSSYDDDDDDGERIVRCRPVHYVLSTGTAQPRRLGPFAGFRGNHAFPPCGVDVGGTLHWARHPWTGTNSPAMLTFDTVSETFRKMPMPPAAATVPDHLINLFDMRGTLAASAMGEWPYLDIWSLDDYAGERWSHHARVELPAAAKVPAYGVKYRYYGEAVAALEGDVLVLFTVGGWVTLYDVKEKRTVRVLRRGDNRHEPCWGLYRESLVPAAIDGLPCSPGAVPFSDKLVAEFGAINYSSDDTTPT